MFLVSTIFAAIAYIVMIVLNVLANTMPINQIQTGEVSFKYPNLFQPTGITFSIWGVIYLFLLIYIIQQFAFLFSTPSDQLKQTFIVINLLFALTSLLNGAWLLAWHFDKIFLSTLIMILLFVSLVFIVNHIPNNQILSKTAFSIYSGWITIALIANITIWLVKLGMPYVSFGAVITTVFVLIIGVFIASLWIWVYKDYVYGAVIIWAYLGIFIRHVSKNELHMQYPLVYVTSILSVFTLVFFVFFTFFKK